MSDGLDHLVSTLRAGAPGFGDGLYPAYRRLRQAGPLYRCPWGDWYILDLDLGRRLIAGRAALRSGEMTPAPAAGDGDAATAAGFLRRWLLCIDPPLHTAIRAGLAPAFMPSRIEALRPDIARLTEALWTAWLDRPQAGFVESVAWPLPVLVIARLLGLPEEDVSSFLMWNDSWRRTLDCATVEAMAAASATATGTFAYLGAHLDRQVAAGVDLPFDYAALVTQCGREAVVANLALLLFAGSETTGHLLASMALLLGLHPEIWTQVKRGGIGAGAVIVEALRCESPVQKIACRLAEPFEHDGRRIAAGDTIVVLVGAAHRDPGAYPMPDLFQPGRRAGAELAFGTGVHACLGRRLAQLEAEIFLDVMAARLDTIEIAGWRWKPETTFRALDRLDLRVGRAAPSACR